MRVLPLASMGLFLLIAGVAYSVDRPSLPTSPALTSDSAEESNGDEPRRTIQHLLKAAEHLEAAGMADEAAKIRHRLLSREGRDLLTLSRKEAELECLQDEVDRLRAQMGANHTILLSVTAVEVDRRKLGLKAREFEKLIGFAEAAPRVASIIPADAADVDGRNRAMTPSTASLVDANPARLPLFRELVENGAVRVLAEPKLTTTTRRPAEFRAGGFMPLRIRSESGETSVVNVWLGTQVDLHAVVLPKHRLRLAVGVELREKQPGEVIDANGTASTGITSRGLKSEVEMQFGQTLVLGRVLMRRSSAPAASDAEADVARNGEMRAVVPDSAEFIVFVTPELATAPHLLQAIPVNAEPDRSPEEIVPAIFDTADDDMLGPPMPVRRRRTGRD